MSCDLQLHCDDEVALRSHLQPSIVGGAMWRTRRLQPAALLRAGKDQVSGSLGVGLLTRRR